MNKQELLNKIDLLPTFILRDIAVKEIEKNEDGEIVEGESKEYWVEKENVKGVTEKDKTDIISVVSSKYQLVQFKEMFKPIAEQIEDFEASLQYYHGFAIMDLFPNDSFYKLDENRVGIVCYNSVDKTSALNIRFCIKYKGKTLTIPKSVASFRKVHLGKIRDMTQDYISVVSKIKNSWNTIVNKFSEYNLDDDMIDSVSTNFNIDSNALKYVKKQTKLGKTYNLWSFCMEVFEYLSGRKYKSEVHRRKRLDKFVQSIFDYQLIMEL